MQTWTLEAFCPVYLSNNFPNKGHGIVFCKLSIDHCRSHLKFTEKKITFRAMVPKNLERDFITWERNIL